jgi:hypothetical protein
MQKGKEACQICQRDLKELRDDVYGNGRPGLKYEFISVKSKMTIIMWLLGIQLTATLGYLIKSLMA